MEQLVSFETGRKAKQKGFDKMCPDFIDIHGEQNELMGWIGDSYEDKYNLAKEFIDIWLPSQSVLAKWLREEHNIDVWAVPFKNIDDEKAYDFISDIDLIYSDSEIGYKTFEEDFEAGLFEALNLLEDVNT